MRTQKKQIQPQLISVIVSAYNYGRYIRQSLESVQAQTYPVWECIVVDDGSTDSTADIVASMAEADARIKYVRQRNRGPSAARNTGIRLSTGEYLQFLDADDLLEPRKLERHVELLEERVDVDLVYGSARYFIDGRPGNRRYSASDPDQKWMPETSGSGYEILGELITRNIMVVSAPVFRRSIVDRVGDFAEDIRGVEDWDYLLRCALRGARFQYLEARDTLSLVRIHDLSLSRDWTRMSRESIKMRWHFNRSSKDPQIVRANRRQIVIGEVDLAVHAIQSGRKLDGLSHLMNAAKASQTAKERLKLTYSALVSLIGPRENFWEDIVSPPIKDSLRNLWQHRVGPP